MVRTPMRCSGSAVRAPTPQRTVAGNGCRKSSTWAAGTTSMPSGLQRADATLATNLVGATPTLHVSASSRDRALADPFGDHGGAALGADRAGDVEERLVERQRLDQRGDVAQDRHHRCGCLRVGGAVGRTTTAPRAQPQGASHRHRAAHAVPARLVRGRGDNAARSAADDDRLAAQVGIVADLDAGEERVHVDVQDRAAGVVAVGASRCAWDVGAAAHVGSVPVRAAGEDVHACCDLRRRGCAGHTRPRAGQVRPARPAGRAPGRVRGRGRCRGRVAAQRPGRARHTASALAGGRSGRRRRARRFHARRRRGRRRGPGRARPRRGCRPAR